MILSGIIACGQIIVQQLLSSSSFSLITGITLPVPTVNVDTLIGPRARVYPRVDGVGFRRSASIPVDYTLIVFVVADLCHILEILSVFTENVSISITITNH